jgi:hypothetical protein
MSGRSEALAGRAGGATLNTNIKVATGGPGSTLTLDIVYVVQNDANGIYYPNVTLIQTNTTVKNNVGGNYCDGVHDCTP